MARIKRIGIVVVTWLAMSLLVACGQVETTADIAAAPAHDFTLATLDGNTLTLSEQDNWTLVNFWATWCVPCITEMPYLQEIADRGDIDVWGVNMRESVGELNAFIDEYDISFPILLEPTDEMILAYRGGLPRSYLIAPDGSLAQTFYGPLLPEQFEQWYEDKIAYDHDSRSR